MYARRATSCLSLRNGLIKETWNTSGLSRGCISSINSTPTSIFLHQLRAKSDTPDAVTKEKPVASKPFKITPQMQQQLQSLLELTSSDSQRQWSVIDIRNEKVRKVGDFDSLEEAEAFDEGGETKPNSTAPVKKKKLSYTAERRKGLDHETLKKIERKEKLAKQRAAEQEMYKQFLQQEFGSVVVDAIAEEEQERKKIKKKKKGSEGDDELGEESIEAAERELIKVLSKNCPRGPRGNK